MALSFEDLSDAAPQTLMNLARTWQHEAADNANSDIRLAAAAGNDHIVFPAVPMATPLARPEDVSEPIRRAAWATIMDRTDDLAFDAVAIAMDRASADLPFRSFTDIHPDDPILAGWSDRLTPTQRTAAFYTLGPDPDDQLLLDPATDAIAVRRQDGNIRAINPGSLPTAEPLSEVILSPIGTVWIRVKNGAVYLAPQQQPGSAGETRAEPAAQP
ncbi:hypothetical protein ACFQ3B_08525 [Stackebrandtia endophytica]|uniref:hypothetical protein n=1 Tax=Stackebrandtia endophytica TaxID=1496996 RepID=UPI00114FB136|nr:hypothetical protein [Stackebrandtia endophytica]